MERIPAGRRSGRSECRAALSIRRHYRELKERVCIESVCDHLIESRVIHSYDTENIQIKCYPRHARVDKLLQILLQKRNESDFEAFFRALRKTGCQDLAEKLENTDGVTKKPYIRDWSAQDIIVVWPEITELLKDELLPEYIIDYFMQENTFTVDDYEEIFQQIGSRKKMTETLLTKIIENLPDAFFVLLYALKKEEKNAISVDELETVIKRGKEQKEDLENSMIAAPMSPKLKYTLELRVKKDGQTVKKIEENIDQYINNTKDTFLLQVFLSKTGCEMTKSDRGCVVVHLRPHSRYAYQKLSEFCKKGDMETFVLNLLREKAILSSLPEGELCIDVKLLYHEEEPEMEGADERQTDLMQMIKDNWSFLCEELDVQTLTGDLVSKKIFNDHEDTELKKRLVRHRYEAANYFLQCLLKKGARGIQALMTALEKKKTTKIIDRLKNSDLKYRNPGAIKENLLVHYDLVVDEIDPSQFEDTFVDRKLMEKKFFDSLVEKQLRRRARADRFLKEVLDKGGRALLALVDVMREMGCHELVDKLTAFEDISNSKKTQSTDDRKEYVDLEVSNSTAGEGLIWSCCLKINVGRVVKDNKTEISSGCNKAKHQRNPNQPLDEWDEGIAEAESESSFTLSSKQDKSMSCRQPDSIVHSPQLDRCLTYPTIRLSDKANTNKTSLLSSAATQVTDSGIDIRDSKEGL